MTLRDTGIFHAFPFVMRMYERYQGILPCPLSTRTDHPALHTFKSPAWPCRQNVLEYDSVQFGDGLPCLGPLR
jgi:hypothetical protein